MRKVLLSVMMVSSLLAFNACKKDGATGPAGATGATGATGAAGAAGAVGAAGAKGADGSKIYSGSLAASAAVGVAGDYLFDPATKTLYGPKTTAWPATGTALSGADGAKGATGAAGAAGVDGAKGATGADGNKFLAGATVPTSTNPSNAQTGDFYYNTATSTFYGPKLADGTWASALPLTTAFTAKTYVITKGFEEMAQTSKVFGQDLVSTYTGYNINSSYQITAGDMIRINQYPARPDGTGGYGENREMIFESATGSNIFNSVPQSAADLGSSTAEIANLQPNLGLANMRVGAKFRYSMNTVNPLAEFTLTQDDIDRLKVNNGAAFGYLTYAKAQANTVALGQNLILATNKNVKVNTSTTRYYATYTARTRFNLSTLIPNIEKYKQDGKVFLKYRYYNTAANDNNTVVNHPGTEAGWADLTAYANSYAAAVAGSSAAFTTAGTSNVNPFTLNAPINHPAGAAPLGVIGSALTVAPNQVATVVNINTGTAANQTTNLDGNVVINWTITSGINQAAVPTLIGLFQLVNNNVTPGYDPVTNAYNNTAPGVAFYGARAFATNYYSATTGTLTANDANGAAIAIGAGDQINVNGNRLGEPTTYFTNTKLVKLQVFVIPGEVVATLRAKGVNVDNINEVSKYVKL